jgi:hypothetical protein
MNMNITSTQEELSRAINGMTQARLNYIQAILATQTALYRSVVSMSLNPWTALTSMLQMNNLQVQEGGKSQAAEATSTRSRKYKTDSAVPVQDSNSEAPADI